MSSYSEPRQCLRSIGFLWTVRTSVCRVKICKCSVKYIGLRPVLPRFKPKIRNRDHVDHELCVDSESERNFVLISLKREYQLRRQSRDLRRKSEGRGDPTEPTLYPD